MTQSRRTIDQHSTLTLTGVVDTREVNMSGAYLYARGIPGVQSDTYHMGYFEDLTLHRLEPAVQSEWEPLIQTMLIFALLLAGVTVASGILFGIREYAWSLNKRRKLLSNGSEWSNRSIILNENEHQLPFEQESRAYPGRHLEQGIEYDHLDIVRSSPQNSATSLNRWTAASAKTGTLNRLIYDKDEMCSLKPPEYGGIPLLDRRLLNADSIEWAIKGSLHFQYAKFRSGAVAEQTISEICLLLNKADGPADILTRRVTTLRLIAIAGQCCSMENGNVFLPAFRDAMDFLIDTGAIFDILKDCNCYLSRCLVDMVIQYSYGNWLFGKSRDPKVLEQFRNKWEYPDPIAQSHLALTRYMVNIQLGLYTVKDSMDEETYQMTLNRTRTLLKHMVQNSGFNDPEGIIPILRQAVEFTESNEMQIFYYALLLKLVQLHSDGLVVKMLRGGDANLKYLIQRGLWVQNHHEIRLKIERVFMILVKRASDVQNWWDEVKGGTVLVSETPKPFVSVEERPVRPGSWRSRASSQRT